MRIYFNPNVCDVFRFKLQDMSTNFFSDLNRKLSSDPLIMFVINLLLL
jgi:hypothetical protein